jgi:hypothetical protein
MMDRCSQKSADGLEYNSKGYLIPPQSGNAWDALTLLLAMAIPLIATQTTTHIPFPQLVLHNLSIFQGMISRNLLSRDQVAKIEFLFSLLLAARTVGFIIFFKKFAGRYSEQSPPPDVLRSLWPPQIRSMLYATAPLVGIPLVYGMAMQYGIFPDHIIARAVSLPIFILSCGLWLLTEVAYGAALYAYFYQRYWRFSI